MKILDYRSVTALHCVLCTLIVSACGGSEISEPSETEDSDWLSLEGSLKRAIEDKSIHGYAFSVYGADDEVIFSSEDGVYRLGDQEPVSANTSVKTRIASGTKWVTSTLTLRVLADFAKDLESVTARDLLDTPIGDVFSCGDDELPENVYDITARQLLSFTSGLTPNNECVGRARDVEDEDGAPNEGNDVIGDEPFEDEFGVEVITLNECACRILEESSREQALTEDPEALSHKPGRTFKYGSAHLTVLGAVLEAYSERPMNALLQEYINKPLGLDWTFGRDFLHPNPNLSGGLEASVEQYARFVSLHFHRGEYKGERLLEADLIDEQQKVQWPDDVTVLLHPGLPDEEDADTGDAFPFEYGLNNFRYCTTEPDPARLDAQTGLWNIQEDVEFDPECSEISLVGHGGRGGFAPWISLKGNYYAVLSIREDYSEYDDIGDDRDKVNALVSNIRIRSDQIMRSR